MEEAISFCKKRNYRQVYLWTFEGLHAARHLYEKFGFRLVEQTEGLQWGNRVTEQKFELSL
jgi:GNAT superfamily N-acetyltransferase